VSSPATPKPSSSPANSAPASPAASATTDPSASSPADASPETSAPSAAPGAPVDEEKIKKHREKTKKALLKRLSDQGGSCSLADLHDYSERRYFVAHRAFSNLMEEFVDQQWVQWDSQAGIVTLTDEGRATLTG
jgi:hypothetical protein